MLEGKKTTGCSRYFSRENYQPMETDTDSLYLSLRGDTESIMRPSESKNRFKNYITHGCLQRSY